MAEVRIVTRFHHADRSGPRITARGGGRKVTVAYDHSASDAHRVAAEKLAEKLGLDPASVETAVDRRGTSGPERLWTAQPKTAIDIVARCEELGVDYARLHACLDYKDAWGKLVHSFEYLTVLGVVEQAMAEREREKLGG